jgi:selenide,water dikinase
VLTKPLGVGASVTARRRGAAADALLAAAVDVMAQLSADSAAAVEPARMR